MPHKFKNPNFNPTHLKIVQIDLKPIDSGQLDVLLTVYIVLMPYI
jgi:hypothetical protein